MRKLSLIVPIYNVDKYLERCLLSLVKQDLELSEYEIILVNDGSKDKSLAIAERFASQYENIKLISKENGGLSSSRNAGLKIATGEYIWFIDSDDWIERDCLKEISVLLKDIDILAINTILADDEKYITLIKKRLIGTENQITGYDLYKYGFVFPYSGVPFYIFKKSFLKENNLFFEEGIIYEDLLFTPSALAFSKKCLYFDKILYYYYKNPASITRSKVKLKNCLDMLTILDELYERSLQSKLIEKQKYIFYATISIIIHKYYLLICKLEKEERKVAISSFYKRKFHLSSIFKSRLYKYIISYVAIYFRKFDNIILS